MQRYHEIKNSPREFRRHETLVGKVYLDAKQDTHCKMGVKHDISRAEYFTESTTMYNAKMIRGKTKRKSAD